MPYFPQSGGTSASLDADLAAIAALTGTGYAKRTAPDTWVLDAGTSGEGVLPPGDAAGFLLQTHGAASSPSWEGFLQAGTGAVERPWQDKVREFVSVKDFGATGNGSTNDFAAIIVARDAAVAAGKALAFPDGTYVIGSTLELAFAGLHVIALGKVIIKHTGTGRAVSFDGSPSGVFNVQFGWGNPFYINGNINTTDLIYCKLMRHMRLAANVRNGTTGMRVDGNVLSQFDLTCSQNQQAFTTAPVNGVVLSDTHVCDFKLIIEGATSYGVDMVSAVYNNKFWGTSEGNLAGGVRIQAACAGNIFHNFDCEANGSTNPDWLIGGDDNIFIACVGAMTTPKNVSVFGKRNKFDHGGFERFTIETGADRTEIWTANINTSFVNNGTNTVMHWCHIDGVPRPEIGIREVLTIDRNYYVATTGNDATNNGLTAGTPFATIQKAIDVVAATLDVAARFIVINVANGTYTTPVVFKNVEGYGAPGTLIIRGNTASPGSVILNIANTHAVWANGLTVAWDIEGFKISTTGGGNCIMADRGSFIRFGSIEFGACVASHAEATGGGRMQVTAACTVSGGAAFCCISAAYSAYFECIAKTITVSGSPNFGSSFCSGTKGGVVECSASTFTGAATGKRYDASINGVISTGGAGATFFPGSIAGTQVTGGQYA